MANSFFNIPSDLETSDSERESWKRSRLTIFFAAVMVGLFLVAGPVALFMWIRSQEPEPSPQPSLPSRESIKPTDENEAFQSALQSLYEKRDLQAFRDTVFHIPVKAKLIMGLIFAILVFAAVIITAVVLTRQESVVAVAPDPIIPDNEEPKDVDPGRQEVLNGDVFGIPHTTFNIIQWAFLGLLLLGVIGLFAWRRFMCKGCGGSLSHTIDFPILVIPKQIDRESILNLVARNVNRPPLNLAALSQKPGFFPGEDAVSMKIWDVSKVGHFIRLERGPKYSILHLNFLYYQQHADEYKLDASRQEFPYIVFTSGGVPGPPPFNLQEIFWATTSGSLILHKFDSDRFELPTAALDVYKSIAPLFLPV